MTHEIETTPPVSIARANKLKVIKYLLAKNLHNLYKKGKFSFWTTEKELVLSYVSGNNKTEKHLSMSDTIPLEDKELKNTVQLFFVETRYIYERDKTTERSKELAHVHGVQPDVMLKILKRIIAKIAKKQQQQAA